MENSPLLTLKNEYSNCQRCPELVNYRTQVVFGSKHMNHAKIMIIGEAPGAKEDELGEPFVGKSGQLLTMFLKEINLTRDDVFITNTILCRPPNNRNPAANELNNCRSRLDLTIKIIKPKVIITLGNFATKYILNTKEGITTLQGKVVKKDNLTIVPMSHPATLLYSGMNPDKMNQFREYFKTVKDLL